ncbi:hypothetical protein N7457_007099 [Penicillium paradoxum]|uniref:uncharacterized protein n=1 Tax=Penicillium paradoxum TaxID=176176 RepID=UPI0025470B86|nr:uncharacterized protein N7457_007099 [Penicillium paradoxum]KAJ5779379.1 hypothetical protein N7457_007099 [Penicillium paradoxum]
MSPILLSPYDQLLHECHTFKANLESQAHALRYDRGLERNGDVFRAVVRLSLQTDRILELGLRMIADTPDNNITRRYPSYWSREGDTSKFETVFHRLERDLDQMALALNSDPSQETCQEIAERLEEIAGQVVFDFGL